MKKIVVSLYCVSALFGVPAFAASADLTNQVERAAAQARTSCAAEKYVVNATAHFEKKVLLKDRMLRPPRRPANPNQVISVEKETKTCQGVIVSNGSRVVVPTVCVTNGSYTLEKVVIRLKTGHTIAVLPGAVRTDEDITWLSVNASETRSVPYVTFEPVAENKSLQDVYGPAMTEHLKRFFHTRGVSEHRRLRPGRVYAPSRLKVGEPLFYKGKLVALVKKRVSTYGGILGGVSESAFAIIR